ATLTAPPFLPSIGRRPFSTPRAWSIAPTRYGECEESGGFIIFRRWYAVSVSCLSTVSNICSNIRHRRLQKVHDAVCAVFYRIATRKPGLRFDFVYGLVDQICIHAAGVDADADGTRLRIRQTGGADVHVDTATKVRDRVIEAEEMRSYRLMTDHQRIRLAAMDQAERYSGVSGMKQRALAFYDVPVVRRRFRREPFRGSGDKVGDHGIDGDTASRDHDSGLPGRAEIGVHTTGAHRLFNGKRRIFLPHGAISAHRQQPFTRALRAGSR